MNEIFKAELVKEQTTITDGKCYYAIKFVTGGGIEFTMRMSNAEYTRLLALLSGDYYEKVDRPHDCEIMGDFLRMVFSIQEKEKS